MSYCDCSMHHDYRNSQFIQGLTPASHAERSDDGVDAMVGRGPRKETMETKAIIITASVVVRRPNCRDENGSCNYMSDPTGTTCKLFFENAVYDRNTKEVRPHAKCREAENCGY